MVPPKAQHVFREVLCNLAGQNDPVYQHLEAQMLDSSATLPSGDTSSRLNCTIQPYPISRNLEAVYFHGFSFPRRGRGMYVMVAGKFSYVTTFHGGQGDLRDAINR